MIYYGNFYPPPLERNSGINTKFYKFNLNDSNLDINTLSATNTQESTKNFSYSILTGFQHSGGTSEDGDLRVPVEVPTIAEKTVTISGSDGAFIYGYVSIMKSYSNQERVALPAFAFTNDKFSPGYSFSSTEYGDVIEAETRFTIIKVSHPDFDVTETINFNIQMQNADAVAYYLYIWVQK